MNKRYWLLCFLLIGLMMLGNCAWAATAAPYASIVAYNENNINGNNKFIAEPAKITSIRAHTGFEQNVCASCGPSGSMPAILLNPPNGIALRE